MKFIKKFPKISITLSVIVLLVLTIFTMHLAHPIITWVLLLIASGFCYMIWRSTKIHSRLHDFIQWLALGVIGYLGIVIAIFINTTVFNSYMYELRKSDYSKQQLSHIHYYAYRLSCNEIVNANRIDTITATGYTATRYSLFSNNTDIVYITGTDIKRSVTSNDTLIDTLRIDGITCGDTVTAIKRKPYWDRNFSLIRTNKKFINSDWKLVDTTYFTNKSPHIRDWELSDIFNDTRAEYRYDRYINKYVLKMMDESKSDTLDSNDDAYGLLNAKCKDKATVAGKLIYAEYDACKSNNTVERIKISERTICGYAKVLLEYDRGAVAGTPDNCMYKSNYGWTYE